MKTYVNKIESTDKKQSEITIHIVIEKAEEKNDTEMHLDDEKRYSLPPLDLFSSSVIRSNSDENAMEMREKADIIVNTLKSFGVEVRIKDIFRGPSVTRYEIQPAPGVRVSKINDREDDIALNLASQGIRIEAPVPGKAVVGIEVPNVNKDIVSLSEMLSVPDFRNAESKLTFALLF